MVQYKTSEKDYLMEVKGIFATNMSRTRTCAMLKRNRQATKLWARGLHILQVIWAMNSIHGIGWDPKKKVGPKVITTSCLLQTIMKS